MPIINPKFRVKNSKQILLIFIMIVTLFLASKNLQNNNVSAHSAFATPIEMFSLWNDTTPTIDGLIGFTPASLSGEWSSAAVYNIYNILGNPNGKLIIQNSNTHLYVAFDMITQTFETPFADWGTFVYVDTDHDGLLSNLDYAIGFLGNTTGEYVGVLNAPNGSWEIIEYGTPGSVLTTTGILVDHAFGKSAFNNLTEHHQYEFRIPYTATAIQAGDIVGAGFHSFTSDTILGQMSNWPHVDGNPKLIRVDAGFWGDLHLGRESVFEKYVIEDNFNLDKAVTGYNNGTFLSLGDITGDGNQELIVCSNRSVSGEDKLIAIYDYVDGDIKRIWASIDSTHYSDLFHIIGVVAYDFDEDGMDELYGVSDNDSRIGRLSGWNDVTNDFDNAEIIFDNFGDSMLGYLAVGDVENNFDDTAHLVFGDEVGWLGFLTYKSNKDEFELDYYLEPPLLPHRIHDIEIADMDDDGWSEFLFLSQYSSDNTISSTNLSIYEYWYAITPPGAWYDNYEDDLPIASTNATQDQFGHSIIVDDVDNDGWVETIIVGKNYVKIFTPNTFNQTNPPLEFLINDGTSPAMGGGAAVIDIDGDFLNELIIGCNNGTVVVLELVDLSSAQDTLPTTYTIEWSGDLGSVPGKRNSIVGLDIDEDGVDEAIIGDNYGQIIVLGLGSNPEIEITSPNPGFVSNQENVLVKWQKSNETLPMQYYEIWVNGMFSTRAGGGQLQHYVGLTAGPNTIDIYGYDVTGKLAIASTSVEYSQSAPEVTIYDPSNYYKTNIDNVMIYYLAYDPESDPLTYDIYRNGTEVATDITASSCNVELKPGGTPVDGYYNITVVADDGNGNIGKDTIWVILDQTNPTITITSPTDGSAVSVSSIELSWTAFDGLTGIDYFEIYRDNEYQGNTSLQYFDVSLSSDKNYNLKVVAYDNVGNNEFDFIVITRDTINPTVELTAMPLPTHSGWYYTDNPIQFIEWTGDDNPGGSGIDHFEMRINDQLYDNYGSEFLNDTIDLGTEGFKEILIIIYDEAGNEAYDYFTIAVDSSDPLIEITSPYDNYITSGDSVIITWDSSDLGTGVKEHLVFVNGTQVDTLGATDFFYELSIVANTTYLVTIQAVDFLDRISEDSVNITQNALAPTFFILNPFDYSSYASSTIIDVDWYAFNIVADSFHIYVNETSYGNYTSSTFSAIIDFESVFGPIPSSSYPVANVTIAVLIGTTYQFLDTRWVTIDQTDPSLAILDPSDLDLILEDSLYVEWSGYDSGSGITEYYLWIDNDYIGSWGSGTTSQLVDVSSYADGWHTIIVGTVDAAGNAVNRSRNVELFPQAPEFTVDVPASILTNNANFTINLDIFDPRLGVSEIQVVADASVSVFSIDYNGTYQVDPYDLDIIITEAMFDDQIVLHNITITVYDSADRGRYMIIDLIIDAIDPVIYQTPILDLGFFSPTTNLIEISEEAGQNNHSFSISIIDTYGVDSVYLNIYSSEYNESFAMIFDPVQSFGTLYVFNLDLNFDTFTVGNYSVNFIVTDNAGNKITSVYSLDVQYEQDEPSTPNWLKDNLYLVIGSGSGVILIILLSVILSVATKKRRLNRGWEDTLEAVAFVTKTGLTMAYVPYAKDLFEDEQLFGGAMTGIVSILGEITGEADIQLKVHVLEYGDKQLMICMGYFGNAILLVNDVKPILKELLPKFLMEFELTYKQQLSRDLIDLNEFNAVELLVESIFGFRKNFIPDPADKHFFEDAESYYQEQAQIYTQEEQEQQQQYDTLQQREEQQEDQQEEQREEQQDSSDTDTYSQE